MCPQEGQGSSLGRSWGDSQIVGCGPGLKKRRKVGVKKWEQVALPGPLPGPGGWITTAGATH